MTRHSRRIWTPGRQVMGNLLPALFALPFAAWGIFKIVKTHEMLGPGIYPLIVAAAVGWTALNFFGFWGNGWLRRESRRELSAKGITKEELYFVGFATPAYRGVLDAHEDIGFLILHSDRLEYFGEGNHVEVPRAAIERIRFRANVHSALGLGRWISVEGKIGGRQIRLLIEPRERPTMLGNLLYGRSLINRLKAWKAGKGPEPKLGTPSLSP